MAVSVMTVHVTIVKCKLLQDYSNFFFQTKISRNLVDSTSNRFHISRSQNQGCIAVDRVNFLHFGFNI